MEAKEGEIMGMVNPDSKIYRLGSYQGPVPGEEDTRLNVWYFAAKGQGEGSNGSQYGMTLQTIPLS